jgi:hypothetical protein
MRGLISGDYMKNNKNAFIIIMGLLLASTSVNAMIKEDYEISFDNARADGLIVQSLQLKPKECPTLAKLCIKALLKKGLTQDQWERLSKIDFSDSTIEKKLIDYCVRQHAVVLENMRNKDGDLLLKELIKSAYKEKNKADQQLSNEREFQDRQRQRMMQERIRKLFLGRNYYPIQGNKSLKRATHFGICADNTNWLMTKKEKYNHPAGWHLPKVTYAYSSNVAANKVDLVENVPLIAHSHNPKGFMVFYDDAAKEGYIVKNNDLASRIVFNRKFTCIPWDYYNHKVHNAWVSDNDKYVAINIIDQRLDQVAGNDHLVYYGKTLAIFDAATGVCLSEIKADGKDRFYASIGNKDGSLIAAFSERKVFLWNPYTGKKKGEFLHPFHNGRFIYPYILACANRECNHWALWCAFVNDQQFAMSWSTDSWNDGATARFIGLYIYDIASGKLLSKTKGTDMTIDYPIYKYVKRCLKLEELVALIALEKQYHGAQKYQLADWQLLQNSKFKLIQELCKTRYLLPEHRLDSEDNKFNSLVCAQENSWLSSSELLNEAHDEDSLCGVQ